MMFGWSEHHKLKGYKMANTEAGTDSRRRLDRMYYSRTQNPLQEGVEPAKLTDQVRYVELRTKDGENRVIADLAKFCPDGQLIEPCMLLTLAAFGLNTVIGNEVAGKTGPGIELAKLMQQRLDAIEDGEWSDRSGPRLKYVLEAWADYYEERKGVRPDASQIDGMRRKLLDGEYSVQALKDEPSIAAHMAKREAERAAAKAKEQFAVAASAESADKFLD